MKRGWGGLSSFFRESTDGWHDGLQQLEGMFGLLSCLLSDLLISIISITLFLAFLDSLSNSLVRPDPLVMWIILDEGGYRGGDNRFPSPIIQSFIFL